MHQRLYLLILLTACAGLAAVSAASGNEAPGGTLVFSAQQGGSGVWSLWRCLPDGKALQRLTADEEDADPRWSPDGKRIVFTRFREGTPGLWLIGADGGAAERVCEGRQASWTPDGKGILFCRDGQVFSRDLASGKEKRLSPEMWEQCAFPAMSPDGTSVVCSSRHEGPIKLYLIACATGAAKRLATSKEACTPRWSADGKTVLFQTSNHVCAIGSDGKDEEDMTFGAGVQHQAQFSPDGGWIVYTRGNSAEGPWMLHLLRRADGAERVITFSGSVRYPDWKKE